MTSTSVKMIHSLYEDGGEGSPSNPVKFKAQDYKQLKETLLKQGKKFEDETFPANLSSLGKLEDFTSEQLSEVEWLRPQDLNPDASFVVDGALSLDFKQGDVGNCWFLSSIGALTLRKSLMARVVPPDQSFKDNYAGIFHFKFWRFGKWVDVVIDDFLPTRNKVPVSVSSRSEKEFWAPLLEKAYAKVCGSYGDMIAGNPPEAFKDFSGGVHMNYKLSKSPSNLWDVMDTAVESKTMMGCGTFTGEKGKEIFNKFGLVEGHAFAVTGIMQVASKGNTVNLVRIWNPWGEKEWTGDWSDKSELWNSVSSEDRDQCLKVQNDGEFWMKMEDFCVYYEEMDICCDSPNFVDGDTTCQWNCSLKEGRWEAGKSAGGPPSETENFWTNPQYRLTVKAVEEDVKGVKNVLLSLLQKSDEEYRSKVKYHAIAFTIYKAPKGRFPSSLFWDKEPVKVSEFSESRELIEFHSLEPGEYVIVPCTYEPNKTASFIITVYSKAETEME
ncbi:calpain-2 catalytic subunit isoform X2 [Dicentrarchus labrax]|uniref:Calpain catalytic domain-containing protein n=1 Tax=Dicentrarchus labrax TaxID=13489 RepID=A0A8C4IR25_DICLA|nr:calpain-2 catalytic subunit isoform X2 [Dicentrarchus labrax]